VPPKKEPAFEQSFRQLEDIVQKLEAGGLPLDDSVTLFEEAMRLAKLCNARLDSAELRITQITASAASPNGVREAPFRPEAARANGGMAGALLDEDDDPC
jgi:exodeoxyribonuclease VII small subunit